MIVGDDELNCIILKSISFIFIVQLHFILRGVINIAVYLVLEGSVYYMEEYLSQKLSWIEGLIDRENGISSGELVSNLVLGTFHNNLMDEPEILTRHHLLIRETENDFKID